MSPPFPGPPGLHKALVRNTGFLISRMGMVAQKQFAERLEVLELTPRMWGALNVLDAEGPITQQALGTCIGMDPSSMVATIDELESRGMVERQRHPNDRRAHALHLTDKGKQTLGRGRELAKGAQEDLLRPLNREERQQLHNLLLRLAENVKDLQLPPAPPVDGERPVGEGAQSTAKPEGARSTAVREGARSA